MSKLAVIFLFFILAFNYTVFAESEIPKKQILKVVKAYAETIGCLINIEEKNVIKFNINNDNGYIVLFGIDPECSGGSAMYHPALAFLVQDHKGNIFIRPSKSFPVATNNLPQSTTGIYIEKDELRYSAKDYNWGIPDVKGDALCCPSLRIEGKLSFKNGKWEAKPILINNNKRISQTQATVHRNPKTLE